MRRVRDVHRHLPGGALTSGRTGTKRAHGDELCLDGVHALFEWLQTTLSVRNHEILRSNNRDSAESTRISLCEGRLALTLRGMRNVSNSPCSARETSFIRVLEEAAQAAATKLKAMYDAAQRRNWFIGSNRTSNEENYLLQKLARPRWNQHIDHHRSADYTGLITALGDRAGDSCSPWSNCISRKPFSWWEMIHESEPAVAGKSQWHSPSRH